MNLVNELQERGFSEGLIKHLLPLCDQMQFRAVRATFYGERVYYDREFWPDEFNRHRYEASLTIARALGRGEEFRALRRAAFRAILLPRSYWRGRKV